MSYVRRQRLSWARIKLSCLLFIYFSSLRITYQFLRVSNSFLHLRFFAWFSPNFFLSTNTSKYSLKGIYCLFFNVLFVFLSCGTFIIILPKFLNVNTFFKFFLFFLNNIFEHKKISNFYSSKYDFIGPQILLILYFYIIYIKYVFIFTWYFLIITFCFNIVNIILKIF